MQQRRLVIAVIAALALLGIAAITEVWLPRVQARKAEAENLLLGSAERLDAFRIERSGRGLEFRLTEKGAWTIAGPGVPDGLVADVRAVTLVAEALKGTRITSVIGDAQDLALPSYGLEPARVTLSWTRPDGRAWTLRLGHPSIAGQVHAHAGDRVVLVPQRVLEATDQGLDHFRMKRVIVADAGQITRLILTRRTDLLAPDSSERLVLARRLLESTEDDEPAWEWILEEPLGVPAQPVRVASLLSRLSALSALGFGAETPAQADLITSGLATPSASILISLVDGREIRLALGDPSPSKNAWARADAGPLVEIRDDIARDALLPDDFWRDNRVVRVPKWRVISVVVRKGGSALDLEIAKDPQAGGWRVVRPGDAELPARLAEDLLGTMEGILCGRFEDDLAADPSRLHERWDFDAPGSFDLQVMALMADGSPRRADAELVPFLRDRKAYFAARVTDEMGRLEACVAIDRDVDEFLDKAREVAALAKPAAAP